MPNHAMRVLLVEAPGDVADSLQAVFDHDDGALWELAVATTFDEARRCLEVAPPDLAVLDARLPNSLGKQLMSRADRPQSVPFVILTDQCREAAIVTEGGAMQYIVQTDSVSANLPRIVERVIRKWQSMVMRRRFEVQQGDIVTNSAFVDPGFESSDLVTELIHEVNQPLAAIVNYAGICVELLTQERHSENNLHDALTKIIQQARRAGDVVDRFRGIAPSDAHTRSHVDLNQLVRDVGNIMEIPLQAYQAQIDFQMDSQVSHVWADPVQIQQVLVNLVQNALEAMDSVEPDQRRISVITTHESDRARVMVCDRGRGLSHDLTRKMFAAHFSTKVNGFGVGLSISRRIIDQHGGWLWGSANTDQGATFEFTLPYAMPKPQSEVAPMVLSVS